MFIPTLARTVYEFGDCLITGRGGEGRLKESGRGGTSFLTAFCYLLPFFCILLDKGVSSNDMFEHLTMM